MLFLFVLRLDFFSENSYSLLAFTTLQLKSATESFAKTLLCISHILV